MNRHYPDVADPRLFELKAFQARRLRVTYADLAELPQYRAACHFFFNRLYSTEDTADRDQAFRKVHHLARAWLGGDVAGSMEKLIELQEITLAMDETMLGLLIAEDLPFVFDDETYERLYRASDNYPLRLRQIELLEQTMRMVHRISHRLGIGLVLSGLHAACLVTGDTRMVEFLQDGYRAFHDQRDIGPLAKAMVLRETERLNRIYGRPYSETW